MKTKQNLANTQQKIAQVSLMLSVLLLSTPAFASLQGGIDKAKSGMNILVTGFFGLVGTAAGLYLLWIFVQCWRGRADWGELLTAFAWIAGAGSALVLAAWLWVALV